MTNQSRFTQLRNRLRTRRSLSILALVLVVAAAVGLVVWKKRWSISHRAIQMADASVRRWARDEVSRLSDGAYILTASTIRVDEARRRISVDTVTLVTDSMQAIAGVRKLPILALQFHNCALQGIDLTRLAAGLGLRVGQAGCDSVTMTANVATMLTAGDSAGANDTTTFLTLTKNLRLPRQIPTVRIDTVAFPAVALSLGMQSMTGRRTTLVLDRLAVRLESVLYDPRQPAKERRTLLSRNALVTLDHFRGSQQEASRLVVDHLAMDLSQRTVALDGFIFEPLPGRRTDSLGFASLDVRHLGVTGVDWRALLAKGDLRVSRVTIDSATLGIMPNRLPTERGLAFPAPTLETSLRAIDRVVQLDSLVAHSLSVATKASRVRTSAVISIGELLLAHVRFSPDNEAWANAFPVGPIAMSATTIVRMAGTDRMALAHLGADIPAQTVHAEGLRAGPVGNDAEFVRQLRFQDDRVEFAADSLRILGVDFLEFIRRGHYSVRRVEATGFALDVLTDHGPPEDTTHGTRHQTPQAALRALGIDYRIDTIVVSGRITIRERLADAPTPGVLAFEPLRAVILNATNDPARMTDSTPLRVAIESRLMHSAPVHVEVSMPLLSRDFRMRLQAEIGAMPASAFNAFLVNATGMKFQSGDIVQIRIASTVKGGHARGVIEPRWRGLHVEFPGIARGNQGLIGAIKRGVAKFAANTFAVRGDNVVAPGSSAVNGVIDYQWKTTQTLPRFVWLSLREPLLPLLKR